ncbi:hypothetical protein RHSIM_Rhsim13G0068300 [Rhododendron simsii]|uniref:DUF3741 domain-containing protein n=1 Tax=Rhododendron simsii TaxID=118357 RepID=A0A834L3D4_RHOSS|nr:hypothetical protein RHSIM_Rhsim13G0068300 [Rhododendron simsii]
MKFLSSTSSSAASTTTTSSSASSNRRSLTGILRKLLCFNSLPANPTDQFKDTDPFNSGELNNSMSMEKEEKVEATANPGIVARLMGLESMPQIARCQSMNYDSRRENEGQNRGVNTSLSFRELPTFLDLENDEFFVLSFDSEVENKEFRSKPNRSEMGPRKLVKCKGERSKSKCDRRGLSEEKDKEKCDRRGLSEEKDKENQEPNVVIVADEKINRRINQNVIKLLKPLTQRETSSGRKQRKEKEVSVSASKAVEAECNLENSSPVSVLDFSEPITDPQVPTSEGSTSRRKIAAELENCKHSPPSPCNPYTNSTVEVEKRKLADGKCHGSRRKDKRRQKYVGRSSGEICKIVKGAMMESNWLYKELWKVEDFEGTGADFELQILETMLNELVDQLVETSQKNFSICIT